MGTNAGKHSYTLNRKKPQELPCLIPRWSAVHIVRESESVSQVCLLYRLCLKELQSRQFLTPSWLLSDCSFLSLKELHSYNHLKVRSCILKVLTFLTSCLGRTGPHVSLEPSGTNSHMLTQWAHVMLSVDAVLGLKPRTWCLPVKWPWQVSSVPSPLL